MCGCTSKKCANDEDVVKGRSIVACRSRFIFDVNHKKYYREVMIQSFRDRKTERFSCGLRVKAFSGFARQALMRLDRLDAATSLGDLSAFKGNRLEALSGDRAGQYSIRINDQWRICFEWPAGEPGPSNVEIVDYH